MTTIQRADDLHRFATIAIAAQICLTATAWLLPFVSRFHLLDDTVSELALGRFGYLQTAAFFIAGTGTLVLALVIRRVTIPTRASALGVRLILGYGLGVVLLAMFPTEEIDGPWQVWSQSTVGLIHAWVVMLSFPCAVAGMFSLTWAFRDQARWRPISNVSGFCSAAALALLFAQSEGPVIGLMRRLLFAIICAWLIIVAIRVRNIASPMHNRRWLT